MNVKRKGRLKTVGSLLVFISVLFLSVFAVNQSLNETNNSMQDDIFIPDTNISLNLTVNISEEDLLVLSEQGEDIGENLPIEKIEAETKEDIIKNNKNKLNEKTEDYLESIEDIKEKRDYIIKFKQSIDEDKLGNVNLEKKYNEFKAAKINGRAEDILELLSDPDIEYLELDQEIETLSENVPYGIDKTNAPYVWEETKGEGVKIAVLDTGISVHTDLSIAGGTSIVNDDYTDNNGHGTAVIGVISALLNNEGLVGVAPEADIYAVKIMESSTGELSNAIAGVEWAIDNNAQVISMSFGMETYSQIFKEVLEEAYSDGMLLIAASGNNGENNILYPAAYSSVIAVGATDENDELASFSSYGNELELVAPGVDINSTSLEGYSVSSGTSMAAPHVTGVTALLWAYNNSLTNEQIRAKLRNDALDLGSSGKDDYYGYGLVQANIETVNYTLENESYFYEVFNITNYGTPDEDYLFWLDGTGTIDDIDFPIGLYLIKKYIDGDVIKYKINVTEKGILSLLTVNIQYYDDFTEEGSTTTDGIVWKGGSLKVGVYEDIGEFDAECYDYDWDQIYDKCYYVSGEYSDCLSYSQGFGSGWGYTFYETCTGGGTCYSTGPANHTLDTSEIKKQDIDVVAYFDCDNSASKQDWAQDGNDYKVVDRKQAKCTGTNSPNYNYQVDYESSDWVTYKSTTCSGGQACNPDLDEQAVAEKTGTIPDPCSSTSDIWIDEDDLAMSKQNSDVNFTLTIHSFNISANNVKVSFKGVTASGEVKQSTTKTINIISSQPSYTTSVAFSLDFDYINIYLDSDNTVKNEIETDNYISVRAIAKPDAYLSISTGLSLVDAKILAYLEKYFNPVSKANADIIIAVGNPLQNDEVNQYNSYTWGLGWKYDTYSNNVNCNWEPTSLPFSGLVGSFYKDEKTRIFLYGTDIDGTIVAVKRLVTRKTKFLSGLTEDKVTCIDDNDEEAFAVTAYLQSSDNLPQYNKNTAQFADYVEAALNDETEETSIYYVEEPGANTQLRLKHIEPKAKAGNPVVLSHGIHSNLNTWEDFGEDLKDNFKDVWLIEMYGGPNTDEDCGDSCPAYTFNDLKINYWPALMAAVQHYAEENTLDYVGYDLGCTVALESLESYNTGGKNNAGTLLNGTNVDLSSYPIDTFVGVACVGNFSPIFANSTTEILPVFAEYVLTHPRVYNDNSSWYLPRRIFKDHLPGSAYKGSNMLVTSWTGLLSGAIPHWFYIGKLITILGEVDTSFPSIFQDSCFSMYLYNDLISWTNHSINPEVGKDVSITNFAIIQSDYTQDVRDLYGVRIYRIGGDNFVSNEDQKVICKNVNSNNKYYVGFKNKGHFSTFTLGGISNNRGVQRVIIEFLNKLSIPISNDYTIISDQQNCE